MTLVQDNSVQAINTALLSIKRDISASTTTTAGTTAGLEPGKTYNINISGNAETATTAKTARTATNANRAETAETATNATTAETATNATTATKVANALTVNGKTYDGSSVVDAGVQTVENGGTGATTAKGAFMNLANGLKNSSGPGDTECMIYKNTDGTNWGLYTLSTFWDYIKGKISNSLEVFIKSKTVTVGDITIPSDNYLEIDVGLTSSDTVISAKLVSWSSNTGVFSIICYAKNRVFIVGDAGTTITNVSVQAIYI